MIPLPTFSEDRRDILRGNPAAVPCDIALSLEGSSGAVAQPATDTLEDVRAERDELRRRLQLIPRVRQDAAAQLAELEAAHHSIRMARDSLLAQVHGLAHSRDEAAGKIAELTEGLEEARAKLNLTQRERDTLNGACEELRAQLQRQGESANAKGADGEIIGADPQCLSKAALATGLAAAETRIAALEAHIERVREQQREGNFQLNRQLIASEKERGAAVAAVAAMRNELDAVTAERNSLHGIILSLEASVARQRAELAEFSKHADLPELLDVQRREIADLTVQLDAAREELRLAWAIRPAFEESAPVSEPVVFVEPTSVALNVAATRHAVSAMTSIIVAATGSPEPSSHLAALGEQLPVLAQRALCAGWLSVRRLADMCGEITKWLTKKPVKLESVGPLLRESFSLMEKIAGTADLHVHEDTEGFEVYALDDDMDNCECVAVALEKIGLRTFYGTKPDSALRDLEKRESKLILLDVKLGCEQTGFDVHAAIRKMPRHERTPVLFVTGLSSAARQITEMATAHDSYLAKPYYLNELSLKALNMILHARLVT